MSTVIEENPLLKECRRLRLEIVGIGKKLPKKFRSWISVGLLHAANWREMNQKKDLAEMVRRLKALRDAIEEAVAK